MIHSYREDDCGVCALANVLAISWMDAAELIFPNPANKLKFGTRTKQLIHGLSCSQYLPQGVNPDKLRLVRVLTWDRIPDFSIVKVIPMTLEGTRDWHWVTWRAKKIWDSNNEWPVKPDGYPHRLVSYIGEAT